jgi:CO/xanthine dehydrogenase Mo-binding subunit
MTDVLTAREFSRTTFLKGGGAMVVGFSMLGAAAASKQATGATDPYVSSGPFDQGLIDSWIVIHADNTATLRSGKIELGQGTLTGLLMIAAEELDLSLAQMRHIINPDTNATPNQGSTVGSQGIRTGGQQTRAAAAAARNALLDLAAKELGVAKSSLSVSNGVVAGGGRTITYGALLGDKLFNARIPGVPVGEDGQMPSSARRAAGQPGTKPISQYRIVGKSGIPRVDIPDKVTGKFVYVHNVRVPGMLHGRVVRPRGQGAYGRGTAPKILSVDAGSIRSIPGARIVRHKDFLGVVAPTEYAAIQAAGQLKVTWEDPPVLPSSGALFKQMREQDSKGLTSHSFMMNTGNFDRAFAAAPVKAAQTYSYQYNGAMAIGPECCVAKVTPQGAHIFSNTQNVWSTRENVHEALREVMGTSAPAENRIRVTYYEGGSVYGGASPYDDTANAAAVMSALTNKPVRLQFMRWDTHGWGNYGPPLLADLRGSVDANGKITGLEYTAFVHAYYSTTPTMQQLTGTAEFSSGSGQLNSAMVGTSYDIGSHRVLRKTIPLEDNAFKMRHLRAPMAPQTAFATEQLVDELAYAAKMDPVAFRFKNIANWNQDPSQRWRHALDQAVKAASWQPKVAASNLSSGNVVTGRGVAFGHYADSPSAAVVDITVNKRTGKISVNEIFAALDAGFVVYPDGLHNNEEGGVIQGVSRALHEAVAFNRKGVTGLDWVGYPILRFADAPKIHLLAGSRTDIPQDDDSTVARSGAKSTGAGEPAVVPIPAAIANAFFDATGVRIRQAPMTPAVVRAVLRAGR